MENLGKEKVGIMKGVEWEGARRREKGKGIRGESIGKERGFVHREIS